MTKEKQIEEMKKALNNYFDNTPMELSFKHENGDKDIITDEKALGVIDAITRQALIPVFCEAFYNADYRKQKNARWKGAGLGDYYCSLCCATYSGGDKYNFCPSCGAKMKGGAE